MYCPKCGKEISNTAKFCQECGQSIASTAVDSPVATDSKSNTKPAKSKKTITVLAIIVAAILVVSIAIVSLPLLLNRETPQNDNKDKTSSVNENATSIAAADIKMVVKLFNQNKTKVLSDYPKATEDGRTILFSGTFANIKGTYNVIIDNDKVSQVIFERDEKINDIDQMVEGICDYLGDYDLYDPEWNKYEWNTTTVELWLYVDERIYFYPGSNDNGQPDDANQNEDTSKIPELKNTKKTEETKTAYPISSEKYMTLSVSDINKELDNIREMLTYDGKHKNLALNDYVELGDEEWRKLLIDGELFGIKGQFAYVYDNETGIIHGAGFYWAIDNYDMHSNQMLYCIKSYFGEFERHKEFFAYGETYNQYSWTRTTDDTWNVWLSLQDSSGWLEITPLDDVIVEEEEKESHVKDGRFTITAYTFKSGFEDAFDRINGFSFDIEVDEDDNKSYTDVDNYLYYRIVDEDNRNRDVGIISFIKPDGKTLHISEEFSTERWNGLNVLIEKSNDVSATVVATIFAVDPGIGYSEAFDVAQEMIDNISIYTGDASKLKSIEHNNILYTLYKDNKYHYLLVTAVE